MSLQYGLKLTLSLRLNTFLNNLAMDIQQLNQLMQYIMIQYTGQKKTLKNQLQHSTQNTEGQTD